MIDTSKDEWCPKHGGDRISRCSLCWEEKTTAELDALRAELARVTAERDAAREYIIRTSDYIPKQFPKDEAKTHDQQVEWMEAELCASLKRKAGI